MVKEQSESNKVKWYQPTFIIATWFYSGKIPFAPGTMGSIFTLPFFVLMYGFLLLVNSIDEFVYCYLVCLVLIYALGHYSTHIYMQRTGRDDPKEVVIDEVVGQLIVSLGGFLLIKNSFQFPNSIFLEANTPISLSGLLNLLFKTQDGMSYVIATAFIQSYCLILFRIFDIWKPLLIGWCDKNVKGSFGVMIDDVVAAFFALAALYGTFLILAYLFAKNVNPA